MQEEPLLLNEPVATAGLHPGEFENGRATAEACLRSLNPAFVSAAGLVGIDMSASRLTVGASEPLSPETHAALQFATGLEVVCVTLTGDKILVRERAAAVGYEPATLRDHSPAAPVREASADASLFGLVTSRFDGVIHSLAAYEPLAKLLGIGYTPREAGEKLLENQRSSSDPTLTAMAIKLSQGMSLVDVGRSTKALPPHVGLALSACRDEASQPSIFVGLVEFEAERKRDAANGRFALSEAAIIWTSLSATWFQLFGPAALLILAAGCWLVLRLYSLVARSRMNDLLRADVLTLVFRLKQLGITSRGAIQATMKRLQIFVPTWGRLPDTREGLADALALPYLSRALLMKGDMAQATQRVALDCIERGKAGIERLIRLSRLGALAGFAIALALLFG